MIYLITYIDTQESPEPQTTRVQASSALRATEILKDCLGLITIISIEEKWS